MLAQIQLYPKPNLLFLLTQAILIATCGLGNQLPQTNLIKSAQPVLSQVTSICWSSFVDF
jgi:hypothetical protein